MTRSTRPGVRVALIVALGLNLGLHVQPAAAKNPCKVSCIVERKGCKSAFRTAFEADKTECIGTGKSKHQCVKAARHVFRAAVEGCRALASTCRSCCKTDGTVCDIQCGDGIVAAGEDCDPPGATVCGGGAPCGETCGCPAPATTSSTAVLTTSTTSTTSVAVSTTSTTEPPVTTTTLPSCSCGDGICRSDEPLGVCTADCRIPHLATFPGVLSACGFGGYASAGQCSQLPSSVFEYLENACWTGYVAATVSDALAVLPPECGGQGAGAALEVGDSVPIINGQSVVLTALRECWDRGIRTFVAPVASCGSVCESSLTVEGFVPIELTSRPLATGNPKGFEWTARCTAEGPCGLGVCSGLAGNCSTCPEDCGGCTPACP